MTRWLRRLQNEVIDFFFPRSCIECGKVGDFICPQCSGKLPRPIPPLCPRCGKPEPTGTFCHECWGKRNGLDSMRSVFIFDGTVRKAVHLLKYYNLHSISECLGSYMAEYYQNNGLSGDILVPVPLHESRIKERGYNQSLMLAAAISSRVDIPVEAEAITRIRNNRPQARTGSVEERRKNMENAFNHTGNAVNGLDVIVVDDVCTSGATLEACASVLKAAGARRVTGFTLAREIKKQE